MEINITQFFNEGDHWHISNSQANLGSDAGRITWRNANEAAKRFNLLDTPDKQEEFRDYCKGFGAWDDEERAAWTDEEANALLLQMVSGDIRDSNSEGADGFDWAQYQVDAEAGRVAGRMFRGDDGQIYYYVGD